jgi:hypothetical protein
MQSAMPLALPLTKKLLLLLHSLFHYLWLWF